MPLTKFLRIKKCKKVSTIPGRGPTPRPLSERTHFEQPFAPISEPLWAVQSDKAELQNTSFEKRLEKVRISILCFMKIIRTKLENTALNKREFNYFESLVRTK